MATTTPTNPPGPDVVDGSALVAQSRRPGDLRELIETRRRALQLTFAALSARAGKTLDGNGKLVARIAAGTLNTMANTPLLDRLPTVPKMLALADALDGRHGPDCAEDCIAHDGVEVTFRTVLIAACKSVGEDLIPAGDGAYVVVAATRSADEVDALRNEVQAEGD